MNNSISKVEAIIERNQKLLQKMNIFEANPGSSKDSTRGDDEVRIVPSKYEVTTNENREDEELKETLQREFAEQI